MQFQCLPRSGYSRGQLSCTAWSARASPKSSIVIGAWPAEHFIHLTQFDDVPAIEYGHTIGDLPCQGQVVRH
jgi:hypothetical protein